MSILRELSAIAIAKAKEVLGIPSELSQRLTALEVNSTKMGEKMSEYDNALADLDQVTTELGDKFATQNQLVRDLQAAQAAGEADKAKALADQAVRNADALEAGIAKLRNLGVDPANPVPDPAPTPPVEPSPDAPADSAGDSPVGPVGPTGDDSSL